MIRGMNRLQGTVVNGEVFLPQVEFHDGLIFSRIKFPSLLPGPAKHGLSTKNPYKNFRGLAIVVLPLGKVLMQATLVFPV